MSKPLTSPHLPDHFERRLVSRNGGIRWFNPLGHVSSLLAEQYIGFEEIDYGLFDVYFRTDLARPLRREEDENL